MINKAHGIMFHHFHDQVKHITGQGSISAETLDRMIEHYSKDHHIIGAGEFLEKSEKGLLDQRDVCITFDDGLLCQYDIAYPVLQKHGLTAFWFIYTSPMDGVLEKVEIYRHFRFSKFKDVDLFYEVFFQSLKNYDAKIYEQLERFEPKEYLKEFPFYTDNDRKFRYCRDRMLGQKKYYQIMDRMIEEQDYDVQKNAKLLWIKEDQIKRLHEEGNIIGLHSYSHPTLMVEKKRDGQREEYRKNKEDLEKILSEDVISVSYPCNSYDEDTIDCMEEFKIRIGFRANMADHCLRNKKLEYPREDHANILKQMEEEK